MQNNEEFTEKQKTKCGMKKCCHHVAIFCNNNI